MRVRAHENKKVYALDGVVCTWGLSILVRVIPTSRLTTQRVSVPLLVPFGMLFDKIEIDNDQDNNYWYRPNAKCQCGKEETPSIYCNLFHNQYFLITSFFHLITRITIQPPQLLLLNPYGSGDTLSFLFQ